MQLWCLSNKLILFTSPRIYSTTHKQRYKNINIRTYKYLFTYFQRRDGPSPPSETEFVSFSLSFSTSHSSVARWGEDISGFYYITSKSAKKKKIEKSKSKTQKAGQEQRHETKAQGHKQTQPADSLIQPRAHSDCAHLGLAELPWRQPTGHWRASASWSFAWMLPTNGGENRAQGVLSAAITSCL